MSNRWENNENSPRLDFIGLQNHCRWWLHPRNLKRLPPWKKTYAQPRQHIKRAERYYFADKSPPSQSCGFSSSHGWMWQCQDQVYKQGFWKHDVVGEQETRHKNSVKSEDQGTNTTPRWRCQNWIQASFIVLSAVKERMCRELNSCGQGQRTKWSLTNE